jgi:hypothetical protein
VQRYRLNGKAALSPKMALRLEKAFGVKGDLLLEKQRAYADQQNRHREKEIAVKTCATGFMDITATQIAAWSEIKRVARAAPGATAKAGGDHRRKGHGDNGSSQSLTESAPLTFGCVSISKFSSHNVGLSGALAPDS